MLIIDGFVKRPDAALRFILVITAYTEVRLIPQDSHALPAAFLRSRPVSRLLELFTRLSLFAGKLGFAIFTRSD